MNERIQELWKRAGGHYDSGNQHTWPQYTIDDPAKFAELIINDCLAQVDKVDEMLDDPAEKVGAAWVGLAIAKHFGVKQ